MTRRLLTILFCLLAGAAGAESAQDDTPLNRLSRFDDIHIWAAVGRVDFADGGYCTGVLIAPDLVLTAAHCLVRKPDQVAVDPSQVVFHAGYADGNSVADRKALMTVVMPDYINPKSKYYDAVQSDIGLIKLDAPIATADAAPFNVGEQKVGNEVSVVSYAHGRSEALSWQRACSVRGTGDGFAAFSCDVDHGSSGAPVFDMTGFRPEIVSVISRGYKKDGETFVFGPIIRKPIAVLEEALRTSKGVNMAGGGLASVVRTTEGARFLKAGDGPRFVKP